MSWKAYEYDSRKVIGVFPDEMTMARTLRETYAPGDTFIVENDDGREFEAVMDTSTVKILSGHTLVLDENDDMYADPGYTPSDS
ncbi:MAG: hypothetical protein LIP28_03705 [Deltaproteobacteria bacterium]|nr:hypothetical protein [Deltaproteobacteria bacterium]